MPPITLIDTTTNSVKRVLTRHSVPGGHLYLFEREESQNGKFHCAISSSFVAIDDLTVSLADRESVEVAPGGSFDFVVEVLGASGGLAFQLFFATSAGSIVPFPIDVSTIVSLGDNTWSIPVPIPGDAVPGSYTLYTNVVDGATFRSAVTQAGLSLVVTG